MCGEYIDRALLGRCPLSPGTRFHYLLRVFRLTNVYRQGKNMLIASNNASERNSQSRTRKTLLPLPLRQGKLKQAPRRRRLRKRKRTNDHHDCFFLSLLPFPRDVTLCIPDLSNHTIMFPCLPVMCFASDDFLMLVVSRRIEYTPCSLG